MKQYSDKEIVDGIASHRSDILCFIYEEMYPYTENFILQHGGSSEQAKDIFQEGMIIVYRKIKAGRFTLVCKFGTYLYAVCKRLWIQERKKQNLQRSKLSEMQLVNEQEEMYGTETLSEARLILQKHFEKLGPDCQQLLRLYFNGVKLDEISKLMGFSSIHNASDKKYRCKKKLIERIIDDPSFSKLKK